MFIRIYNDRITFTLWNADSNDFLFKKAFGLRCCF